MHNVCEPHCVPYAIRITDKDKDKDKDTDYVIVAVIAVVKKIKS